MTQKRAMKVLKRAPRIKAKQIKAQQTKIEQAKVMKELIENMKNPVPYEPSPEVLQALNEAIETPPTEPIIKGASHE